MKKYTHDKRDKHSYGYDANHRLTRYAHETTDTDKTNIAARYLYDPFGRRVARQTQESDKEGTPIGEIQTTFYGWDGDRLVLTEQGDKHIHTIYEPNSFIPLMRIEGKKQKPMQTLAQKVEQHTGIKLIPQNVELFHRIELKFHKIHEDINETKFNCVRS